MNSRQIDIVLKNIKATKKYFLGVFSSDNIPKPAKTRHYPYCFVANTDKSGNIGEHWVAFFVKSAQYCEYFDSLGDKPNADLSIYLNTFKKIQINNQPIQFPLSDACGHFCIYFLVSRCAGSTYCEIMDTLYRTRALADFLVKSFVRTLMRL